MFLAHVTHEAVQQYGGIGAVLRGLITARNYKSTVKRTVLVGPYPAEDRKSIEAGRSDIRLAPAKEMEDRTAAVGLGQIEQRYGVKFYHGFRRYAGGDAGVDNEVELLLIDVSEMPKDHVKMVKQRLQSEIGVRFDRMRLLDIYETFVRLAVPAYEGLLTLRRSKDGPCVMISHECFGLPLAYLILLRRDPRFRTIFHAHEVAVVRPIIEKRPAHDIMFYNVLGKAMAQGKSLPEIFGPQESQFAPAMVMRAHMVDRIFAVGDNIADEMRFLGKEFADTPIDLVYNGVGASKISLDVKKESHTHLEEYTRRLLGWRPNFILTHVARPVVSKGFWRDLQVMAELDTRLHAAGEKAVLYILASATLPRTPAEVAKMEKDYNWPVEHRTGYPDLAGPETAIDKVVKAFNRKAKASRAVFVNQFGWEHGLCGKQMPKMMSFADIRRGTDVEFGLSTYEPFGIAQIEPLPFGAICLLSSACGCRGFIEKVDQKKELANVIVKDYTAGLQNASVAKLTQMKARDAAPIEKAVAAELAEQIFPLLPRSDKDRKRLLTLGYRYARQMSWDLVVRDYFLPGVRQVLS